MTSVANCEVTGLFLEFSDRKLVEQTKKLMTCVEKLSEEQVWARGGAHENSAGNLMLHLCGNMRQWIMHGVGGKPDVRTRDAEFSADGGMTKAELMALFTATVEEARGVIASLPHARLSETIHPQGRETSVLGAIYQVVGHVQEHVGQVILLTKQMVGMDLDLTIPRKR
jgi:uncharacterized damage-inducible protein DinB